MPEMQTVQGGVIRTVGSTAGTSSVATQLTANASADTKGSYVELTAATEFDADWVLVSLTNTSGLVSFFVDLSIGAATEQIVIPDMFFQVKGAGGSAGPYLFPLFIPKGSRLAARCQSNTGSATCRIAVTLIAGTLLSGGSRPSVVSTYGAAGSTIPTSIDPGGTANTDSAWVQLTAATTRDHHWLAIGARCGDINMTNPASYRFSIGIGAATEQVLIPDLHSSADATADVPLNPVFWFPVFIPAGSRLTAKARSSVTTTGDRVVFLMLYGC